MHSGCWAYLAHAITSRTVAWLCVVALGYVIGFMIGREGRND